MAKLKNNTTNEILEEELNINAEYISETDENLIQKGYIVESDNFEDDRMEEYTKRDIKDILEHKRALKSSDTIVENYIQMIGRIPRLTATEEIELAKKVAQGDEAAKTKMIESNLRLVAKMANIFYGRGLEFMDLVQEGNIGLMKAVEMFDYTKGYKFSTYAVCWIKQKMSIAVENKGRMIRLPVHVVKNVNHVSRESVAYKKEHGRYPTNKELATKLNILEDAVIDALNIVQDVLSLDKSISDEDDEITLGDTIPDDSEYELEQSINRKCLKEEIDKILCKLDEKEEKVIRLRFGIDDGYQRTLAETSVYFDCSREYIRRIEGRAIKKLRFICARKKIDDFLVYT